MVFSLDSVNEDGIDPSYVDSITDSEPKIEAIGPSVEYIITYNIPVMRAHAALGIIAWVGFATFGTIIARYFRESFKAYKKNGVDLWLRVHIVCMSLTYILTVASFILAFIAVGGWRTTKHGILGICLMAIATVQPILVIVKPCVSPEAQKKVDIMHFFVGSNVVVFGFIVTYYGLAVPDFSQTEWVFFVLTFYVGTHVLNDTTFRILKRLSDEEIKRDNISVNSLKDPPMAKPRRMTLIKYGISDILFTTALVVLVCLAPWYE